MYTQEDKIKELQEAAVKEFISVGFRHASLRKICENAGVSTGFLYSHFKDKDALFDSLVSEFADELPAKMDILFERYWDDYSADSPIDKEQDVICYLYDHKDAVILLCNHAGGTDYEDYKEMVFKKYLEEFMRFFRQCIGDDDENYLAVMCRMRYQSYEEIIKRNLSLEESLELAKRIGVFKAAGLHGLKMNK
jgi:AcrR family transcriptional regulator